MDRRANLVNPSTTRANFIAAVAVTLLLAACSSAASTASQSASPLPAAADYMAIVVASEFVVGEDRFPFGLVSMDGNLLENAQVRVRFSYLKPDSDELRGEAPARFLEIKGVTPHQHAGGEVHEHLELRSVYVAHGVKFDTPGFWRAEFLARTATGQQVSVGSAAFEVKTESSVPYIGELVPPSRNLTLADVDSIEEIETRVPPDGMHELSVAQALEQGKPFVVVFATPMFCVTRMCGPVTDIAAALHERYSKQVNFIHIEPWDLKIARSEGRLVPIDVALEWNLPTEPWVFVVDKEGKVASRFEGLVSSEELENAITAVLP